MAEPIRRVCVIGAGVMGAGIAAQVANSGTPVLLLDIVKDPENRNAIPDGAVAKMLKTEPAPFMSKAAAKLVETGNIEDDLARVAECDWVVEAIIERLDIKQDLYRKLAGLKKPGTAVSSNTSTIPLHALVEGLPEAFRRDFLITHFFNPPRYMRLLELVRGKDTDPAVADRVSDFCDRMLGKAVVPANDSPGFIANRIGTYWLQVAVNAAIDQGLTVEEADAVGGAPMGVPKTGVFGLIDLVGLDLMPLLQKSLGSTLKPDDAFHATVRQSPLLEKMIAGGYTGRKGKGGFYRINREAGKRKEAIDLATGDYRPVVKAASISGAAGRGDIGALVDLPGKAGAYAWAVLGPTLAYAAALVPEAASDIVSIDAGMKLGYNWKWGPFELIDRIGARKFAEKLKASGIAVPPLVEKVGDGSFYRTDDTGVSFFGLDGQYHPVVQPEGVLRLEDVKRGRQPVAKNASAALWDIGDGVACLEFTSKMNALDGETLKMIGKSVEIVGQKFKALVIYNESGNFSAGANLGLAMFGVNIAAWGEIEKLIAGGQMAMKALKYAPFPVVGAPAGMALGGGCETLLHCGAIQAHAETYIGLVEPGVGLIPGWGGNGEMLDRWRKNPMLPKGPMPAVAKVFEIVSVASVSKSAAEAKELGFLRPTDGITMNRDRLLADAKAKALSMVDGYTIPSSPEFRLPGESGRTGLNMAVEGFHKRGMATDYDLVVSDTLARVLTGGDADVVDTVSEMDLLTLEREGFIARMRDTRTMARVEHMLETGKPLRN